ncbi:LLM class flavin-dependent oxidoreductase [Cellulomonas shaoxiangyii]|uniref:LLM class flavin-dependent oxidoreductase n=1 Tax=Cellulomonas shaoxiangyii TaxID=2566013 RepID=A0A4P7SEQ0_9CELL|nr:LLM class flavin-dependent oxidoreductase [Cellulomonas shaoxiangyii]QCB92320.1 LLM class flavin-dependent oxidoreductase [Cellulomonas shaoxiangyii]TGY86286.1 LLM class flavin-dependent oxidoreductase [Cellulomonas shaoxiangyii]
MTRMQAIGVMLPRDLDPGRVTSFARRADDLGFDELWVVEDLGFRGGIAQAAAVLASTARVRVGVGILPAAVRNVAFAAMEVATLVQLFPGRVDVGIGHGMPDWMRQVGAWPARPLTLLEEYVVTLRALLRGEAVTSPEGSPLALTDVALDPSCVPATVPDLLAGVRGPRSLAAAGRVADGTVLAEPVTPEYARAALAQVAPAGPHRVAAYNVAAVDDDAEAALDAARPALAWIGEPDWDVHIAPLPFADAFRELRASCATRAEFVERLPAEWVARLALAGTPDEVRARLASLAEAGVTSAVLLPAGPDPVEALTSLARVL